MCKSSPPFTAILKNQQLCSPLEINALCASFFQLVQDRYFPAQAGVRYRRYSQFHLDTLTSCLQALPHTPFLQDKAYNPLAGNIPRHFAPLSHDIASAPALAHIIKTLVAYFPCHHRSWKINVHQMRVVPTQGKALPAPEGRHQDGHDYIAIMMIHRHQISGGENSVFDQEGKLLFTTTLNKTFDTLLLDDRKTYHSVSAIQSTQEKAYRDMLIIDFNKMDPETPHA